MTQDFVSKLRQNKDVVFLLTQLHGHIPTDDKGFLDCIVKVLTNQVFYYAADYGDARMTDEDKITYIVYCLFVKLFFEVFIAKYKKSFTTLDHTHQSLTLSSVSGYHEKMQYDLLFASHNNVPKDWYTNSITDMSSPEVVIRTDTRALPMIINVSKQTKNLLDYPVHILAFSRRLALNSAQPSAGFVIVGPTKLGDINRQFFANIIKDL